MVAEAPRQIQAQHCIVLSMHTLQVHSHDADGDDCLARTRAGVRALDGCAPATVAEVPAAGAIDGSPARQSIRTFRRVDLTAED